MQKCLYWMGSLNRPFKTATGIRTPWAAIRQQPYHRIGHHLDRSALTYAGVSVSYPVEVTMSTPYRGQILLESEQHQALAQIAEQEGRTISDLVREIVEQHLAERRQQDQQATALQAIERLIQIRSTLEAEFGMVQTDPLAGVRAEWEKDVKRTWQGDA